MTVLFSVNQAGDTVERRVLWAIVTTGEFVRNFPTAEAIPIEAIPNHCLNNHVENSRP